MSLTDKQKRFCEEYIVDLNATQAAIRAGYSEKTARQTASEYLAKPNIQEYVSQLQKELSERTGIRAEDVIKELAKIGFSDIRHYYDGDDSQKDITQLDNKFTAAISSLKVTENYYKDGKTVTKEFKLHDKVRALEDLGKHLGVFEKDNRQKQPDKIQVFKIGDKEIEF
jgi:phage terminase small subunit